MDELSDVIYLTCPPRETQELMQELEEWFFDTPQAVKVLRYGITDKAHDGFLFLRLQGLTPEKFRAKLQKDTGIFDFVVCPQSTFTQE